MNKRIDEVLQLSTDLGLDYFPIVFEVVSESIMYNMCSYGLPTRMSHWSYGRAYDFQKTYGEMGYSKVYELIVNNNPAYAFMMDTNTEVQNLFIAAHCAAHSCVYKNNVLFQKTDRSMVSHAAEHAGRIENYIQKYGLEKVERIMDIGFSLSSHLDPGLGVYRKNKEIQKANPIMESEFSDFIKLPTIIENKKKKQIEKDLLWFFINNAPLKDWEVDVLDMIREEAYYFQPIQMTKILHEGFASYWHAEVMFNYNLSPQEHIDFVRTHEKVVQPGSNPYQINPYYLGFKILKDVEKRWDKYFGNGAGKKKILEIARDDDDISLIRNYLTTELVEELNLFTFGYVNKNSGNIEIKSRMRDDVVSAMISKIFNGGIPKIIIEGIGKNNTIYLKHEVDQFGTLHLKHASKTLEYIWDIWAAPIELMTMDSNDKEIILHFDEGGLTQFNEDDFEPNEITEPI